MSTEGIPSLIRMEVHNFDSGEWKTCLSNPAEIEEAISPIWDKLQAVGSTSGRLDWKGTDNRPINFSLYFDADKALEVATGESPRSGAELLMEWRRFLLHFCYPVQRDDGKIDEPPDAVFVWPGFMAFRTKVANLTFRYTRWTARGAIDIFVADVRLLSVSDVLVTSQDARTEGPERIEYIFG